MKRRVFVAINLPEAAKKKIDEEAEKIKLVFEKQNFSGCRFAPPQNLHLTISFLGYQDDNSVALIADAAKETAKKFENPQVVFEKIIYGPPRASLAPLSGPPKGTPRMIWLSGSDKTSKNLTEIKNYLENLLLENGVGFQQENRPYKTHLTLARFETAPKTSLPAIEKDFRVEFSAKNLDLMESHLKKTGAEYEPLSSFNFKTG